MIRPLRPEDAEELAALYLVNREFLAPFSSRSSTAIENVPSQRVLEKAAFERIGLARRYLRINGVWRDFFLFQRLAH